VSARGRLAAGAALALLSACGSSSSASAPPWHNLAVTLPPTLAGYSVTPEPKATSALKSGGVNSLLAGGTVFSLRRATTLYAVFEIGQLRPGTNGDDGGFQQDVADQLGQSVPRAVRVDGHTVYQGRGASQQSLFCWFTTTRMMVLLTHDIKDPNPLLEAALGQRT
jgi:hypothetical protein